LRLISWVGVAVVAAAVAVWTGTGGSSRSFDGERAFADLEALVRIGPRPPGSEGAERTRALIEQRLRQAGWPVRRQELEVLGPQGERLPMVNLIAVRRGERPDLILLAAHYDTKELSPLRFVGANDGASGVALLLELARVLGAEPGLHTVWLVFFDGEEALGPDITPDDGLYGSRALAVQMRDQGTLQSVRAFILVDMVADRDLNLAHDLGSDPRLRALLAEEAARLGLDGILDPSVKLALVDDHTPFVKLGMERVLAIIDFQFGARRMPGPYWHTERDDLSAVSALSLNSVGRLVVETFRRIEGEAAADKGAIDR
jgi:glutaminyl-peptide cyclotransferase